MITDRKEALEAIKKNSNSLNNVSDELKNSSSFMLQVKKIMANKEMEAIKMYMQLAELDELNKQKKLK